MDGFGFKGLLLAQLPYSESSGTLQTGFLELESIP
jgi:hypothetical protein